MSQIRRNEPPGNPLSLTGISISALGIISAIRMSGFKKVSHSLLIALLTSSIMGYGVSRSSCFSEASADDFKSVMQAFVPSGSFFRIGILCVMLLLQGAFLEPRLGSLSFLSALIGNLVVTSIVLVGGLSHPCFPGDESIGPVLACTAVLLHGHNPKIHTEALPSSQRLGFPIEPRWFMWACLALYTLFSDASVLMIYIVSVGLGAIPYIPSIVGWLISTMRSSAGRRRVFRLLVLVCSLTFLPFSVVSWTVAPWQGPTIFHDRGVIAADWFSLVASHVLLWSPLFLLLDAKERILPVTIACSVIAWIYCSLSPAFVTPGPGLVGLAYFVYSSL
jgi:hypothetical protein